MTVGRYCCPPVVFAYAGRVISRHRFASRSNVSADISNPRAAVPPTFAARTRSFSATTWQACASSRHSSGVNRRGYRRHAVDDTGQRPVTSKPSAGPLYNRCLTLPGGSTMTADQSALRRPTQAGLLHARAVPGIVGALIAAGLLANSARAQGALHPWVVSECDSRRGEGAFWYVTDSPQILIRATRSTSRCTTLPPNARAL